MFKSNFDFMFGQSTSLSFVLCKWTESIKNRANVFLKQFERLHADYDFSIVSGRLFA